MHASAQFEIDRPSFLYPIGKVAHGSGGKVEIDQSLTDAKLAPVETPAGLATEVRRRLTENPIATWDEAVREIAEEDA